MRISTWRTVALFALSGASIITAQTAANWTQQNPQTSVLGYCSSFGLTLLFFLNTLNLLQTFLFLWVVACETPDSALLTSCPGLGFGAAFFDVFAIGCGSKFAVRSSNSYLELNRFGQAKQRLDRVHSTSAERRKLLQVAHLRGWLFTR